MGESTDIDFGGEMHPRTFSQVSPPHARSLDKSRLHGAGRLCAEARCEVLFEAFAAHGSADRVVVGGSALTALRDCKAVGPEMPN